jgi:hypothetical protein
VLDEVDEGRLSPLQIIDDEDEWPATGKASSTFRTAQNASSGAIGSPAGLNSSAARAAARASSVAARSIRPLGPNASTSGHQVRPSP